MREQHARMKGNTMNSDDKLECLRLAIEYSKDNYSKDNYNDQELLRLAQQFYNWISEHNKPNNLTFDKINPERK